MNYILKWTVIGALIGFFTGLFFYYWAVVGIGILTWLSLYTWAGGVVAGMMGLITCPLDRT